MTYSRLSSGRYELLQHDLWMLWDVVFPPRSLDRLRLRQKDLLVSARTSYRTSFSKGPRPRRTSPRLAHS